MAYDQSLTQIYFCQGIDRSCNNIATKRRRDTAYVDDDLNFVVMCDSCFELEQQYWADMWSEYYSQRL